jgi:hypothetical protein
MAENDLDLETGDANKINIQIVDLTKTIKTNNFAYHFCDTLTYKILPVILFISLFIIIVRYYYFNISIDFKNNKSYITFIVIGSLLYSFLFLMTCFIRKISIVILINSYIEKLEESKNKIKNFYQK